MNSVSGDLLTADTEYIVQQMNCCTTNSCGLAAVIAEKWPSINPYASRIRLTGNWATAETRAEPGTISVYPVPVPPPQTAQAQQAPSFVVCVFAQVFHGRPGAYNKKDPLQIKLDDGPDDRLAYFRQCLVKIADIKPKPKSVGFPFRIGCGLAGGNWVYYSNAIRDWSALHPDITVKIYRL